MSPCPLCGSSFEPMDECEEIQVKDYGTVTVHFSVCEECGAEIGMDKDDLCAFDLQRVASG